MNKIHIYVCENFSPEYEQIAKTEKFTDVVINPYPCLCESKKKREEVGQALKNSSEKGIAGLLFCGKNCDVINLLPENDFFECHLTNYCFQHIVNEKLAGYIIERGGYIIGSGWLREWRRHMEDMGFDRETARRFYGEFSKELVFFDAKSVPDAEKEMRALSEYLAMPYTVIPTEADTAALLLKSAVYERRLRSKNASCATTISELQVQCAEYSAALNLMGQIAMHTDKREMVRKIKEIFIAVLGADYFKYYDIRSNGLEIPDRLRIFLDDEIKTYEYYPDENRIYVKITLPGIVFGVIEAGDFLFPQYIEKYLSFAIEISRVCGLVLTNIEQYERIMRSEKEFEYNSQHDALTGLYNRTYLNKILEENGKDPEKKRSCVFMFDIDGLKHVNDTYGHTEGDKLILAAASILKKSFRERDVLARIGGDEFIVIVSDCDEKIAEKLNRRIAETVRKQNEKAKMEYLKVSISVGAAIAEKCGDPIEPLMQKADLRMYDDKSAKKRLLEKK